jgi:hypothetical protein
MKKFIIAALFAVIIFGALAPNAIAQPPCNQIVFSEVADHWAATRYEESSGKWRVGIVGKMKPDVNFAEYFISPGIVGLKPSDFYSAFYVNEEKIVERELSCKGGTAKSKGQWFICSTQEDIPKLPQNAKVYINWRGSDWRNDCGTYGPMAIKLDANNNFIPDDHPADNKLPEPPTEEETAEDSDSDGVADSLDECDDTPEGTYVGDDGCPSQISSQADADIAPGAPAMPGSFADDSMCSLTPIASANTFALMIAATLAALFIRRRKK